jgi:uncharacterized protein (TIRG00374 family)
LRSFRFWLLVNSVKGGIELRTSIGVTLSSYFLSTFVPARLGESVKLVRPKNKYQVPYTATGFTVIIEKTLDLVCITTIVFFLISVLLFLIDLKLQYSAIFWLQMAFILVSLAVISLIVIFLWGDFLISRLEHRGRIGSFLKLSYFSYKKAFTNFLEKPLIIGVSVVISLLIWTIDSTVLVIIFTQISDISNNIVILITIISALFAYLTFIFPISPGNIGSYELAVSFMFIALYPVPVSLIIGAALIEHGLKTLIHIVLGSSPTLYYIDTISSILTKS